MTPFQRALLAISTVVLGHVANASPTFAERAIVKTSVKQLEGSYDYIVVGGGTAGLTVANRLSEDPTKTVLVIEIGYFGDEPCIWMPLNTVSGPNSACLKHRFNITSAPQPEINNIVYRYAVGAVVGGSSAVNGMVFDRGAKEDYDGWEELGNPGWGWHGLLPYFKKSVTFTPPSKEDAEKFGYTWDLKAWGNGPVQASFPPFQWEALKYSWAAWEDMGIPTPREHALGDAIGRFWVPSSEHPVNRTRSYARFGYYDPASSRPNYHLLIGHKAKNLVISRKRSVDGVVIHQRDDLNDLFTVKARKEVILSTGAVHTPQILELSGVGSKSVLEAAGIPVKLNLPGVGQNFQDHPQPVLRCTYTNDFSPNPSWVSANATFFTEALAQYNANKTGPLTLALNSAFVFLPLNTIHSNPSSFHAKLASQTADAYLLPGLPDPVVRGYQAQKRILAKHYKSPHAAVYESPFGGVCSRTFILQKPLSRGSIHINASDPYGDPVVDFRAFTNPLDFEQGIESVKYTRKYFKSKHFELLGPVETGPGANVTDDDYEGLLAWARATNGPTSFHASGTAAMMPRELGGVVDSELKVYGLEGVSVVDASIMPLIPGTHLSATVYAIAEKAADIIKGRA